MKYPCTDSLRRVWLVAVVIVLGLLRADTAWAIINQVDGTVVPVTNNLQSCLDKSSVMSAANPAPGEGPGVLNAIRDAAIRPQVFLPNPSTNIVTFTVLGEGAGYQNRFGWYHVGDSPFDPSTRREVFNCRNTGICSCPCLGGPRNTPGPVPNACVTWPSNNTVRIDFGCLRGAAIPVAQRWRGGPVAFYLMTPELLAGGSSGSCAAEASTTNRIYSTDNTVNDDGDYVHFLIYSSVTFPNSFYFGFEDLFRGGDNDFEDMLVRANGLVPTCNPQPETCNNRDDNCDGVIDNFTEPCSTACGAGTRRCVAGVFGACSAPTPSAEVCNNLDDNCNGQIDEGISAPCTAACGPGRTYCVRGAMTACVSTRVPSTEICNNIDDNCNGAIDEGLMRPCSSACGAGTETCTRGAWGMCSAAAPGVEVCNGRDDDCDGLVDEMLPDGPACGATVGACRAGVMRCVGGAMACVGATGPSPEVCNNIDDNCNGMTDEGLADGGPCGRAVGACRPGTFVCRGGAYVCDGATSGTPEVCNNIDDDCNGVVDDGIAAMGTCNAAPDGARLCTPGQLRCRAGRSVCEGGTRAGTEVCDCMDNDCDGIVDNVAPGGASLCPGGGSCIACQCRTPCASGEFPCSSGLVCREGFCVPPTCGGVTCRDGQRCVNNACVDACTGVTCSDGQVCRNGVCREDSCYVLGCPDPGQVCVDNACVANACRDVTCGDNEFCRDGTCVRSCLGVRCVVGNRCVDGECIPDACAGVRCDSNEQCVLRDGAAVCEPNPCRAVSCGVGRRCDATGQCVDNACNRIRCPGAAVCRAGQCESEVPTTVLRPDRGIAGGGGCSARPGSAGGSERALGWFALVAMAALVTLRKRAKSTVAAGMLVAGTAMTGCTSAPYCFNCTEGGVEEGGTETDAEAPRDVVVAESCVATGEEQCNGLDDDCDGEIDEDFNTQTDPRHCGACGMRCELEHALPGCAMGRCTIASCDIGYYDLDSNPLNGCEYACNRTGDNEVCDRLDNNCDGRIDEGIDLQTSVAHCGRCDNACSFANGTAQCTAGMCALGACAPGFVDVDGRPENGCEYACLASGPEVCDGRDNNCNGMVDEGFDLTTDAANCGRCGNRCTFANGIGRCSRATVMGMATGVCSLNGCAAGFVDADMRPENGCEYACVRSGVEVCDGRDNDCNGVVDDGMIAGVGVVCGASDVGDCARGRTVCERGAVRCVGEVGPTMEVCDGRDNDCDGAVDELPLLGIGAGTTCGTDVGACSYGMLECRGGAVVCGGGSSPGTESCNGIDDDCDGEVDEGVTPPVSFTCAPSGMGTERGVCVGAPRFCDGAAGFRCRLPDTYRARADEAWCDGLDNNCDGRVDEGCLRLFPVASDARVDASPNSSNTIQPVLTGTNNALGVAYLDNRAGNADIFFARSVNTGTSWAEQLISRDPGATNQVQPWLAGSGTRFVSVWSDFRSLGNSRSIFGNRSTDEGASWAASDVELAASTTDRFNVRVVTNGTVVTAIYEALFANRERHINVSVSLDGGVTWPTFRRVDHAVATVAQPIPVASTPAMAVSNGAMGTGSVIHAVWRDNRNGSTDVYYNRSVDFGQNWLAVDVRMDTDVAGARSSVAPSVSADAAGNVLVAWQDNQTGTGTRFDIYSRRSIDAGATFNAANVRVDADSIAHDSTDPIALVTGSSFAVVWLDDRDGRTQVYANRSLDRGVTWLSADVRVQTHAPAGTYAAQDLTASASNGSVFVAWSEARDTMVTSPLDLRGSYSLDGGETFLPGDLRLDSAATDIDSETPFAYSTGGIGHFVWVDRRADRINGNIFYRSMRP
ncbi:MAG: MopE-related protein [Deltaproteobacteria bacterium]|nr:MopE-related protein [Deltaproteobacteria bacterium]